MTQKPENLTCPACESPGAVADPLDALRDLPYDVFLSRFLVHEITMTAARPYNDPHYAPYERKGWLAGYRACRGLSVGALAVLHERAEATQEPVLTYRWYRALAIDDVCDCVSVWLVAQGQDPIQSDMPGALAEESVIWALKLDPAVPDEA